MTISYGAAVSEGKCLSYVRILFFWRGSVWKDIYVDLIAWLMAYAVLSVIYRIVLNDHQREQFEAVVAFADKRAAMVPISFLLGFYVLQVLERWFVQFDNLGWLDGVSHFLIIALPGSDEHIRMVRRSIVRYMVFFQALVYRDISTPVRQRLFNEEAMVQSGLCTADEVRAYVSVVTPQLKHFVPFHWAMRLLGECRKEGTINEPDAVQLHGLMNDFRLNLEKLLSYDWIPIPLAYTQVVFLTVRAYFLILLLGRQFVYERSLNSNAMTSIDLYVPAVGILEFVFYMGWAKVAEALMNPFGSDDNDFELNWVLDRNLEVGLSIADDCVGKEPKLSKDPFWSDKAPELLYTIDTVDLRMNARTGSAADAEDLSGVDSRTQKVNEMVKRSTRPVKRGFCCASRKQPPKNNNTVQNYGSAVAKPTTNADPEKADRKTATSPPPARKPTTENTSKEDGNKIMNKKKIMTSDTKVQAKSVKKVSQTVGEQSPKPVSVAESVVADDEKDYGQSTRKE